MSRSTRVLLSQVPPDRWHPLRLLAIATCTGTYLWWLRAVGLITDRITAAVSVGVFLICAFVGRPWHRWMQVLLGALAYAAMWFVYESTRGAADQLGMPYQMAAVRNLDRVLFLGTHPVEAVQRRWYDPGVVHWYDQLLSLVYYSHFVVPVVLVAAVWATSHVGWVRLMRRFATVVLGACVVFVLMPTVPPWMASDERFGWGVGRPLVRHVRRGILDLGFTGFAARWETSLDWSNVVAAMPSLHAALSLFVVVWAWPMVRDRWLRLAMASYPALMAIALVYFAEHWVVDVVAGWALVAASFALWARLERRWRLGRVAAVGRAEPALAERVAERLDALAATAGAAVPRSERAPRALVLDRSVLDAAGDPQHPHHQDALDGYADAIVRFIRDEVRLVARHDHLASMADRHRLLAPVRPVRVAAEYRRTAHRLAGDEPDTDRRDQLVTLVTARRERAVDVLTAGATPIPV